MTDIKTPTTPEYQLRELNATMCELYRATWFIADINNILSESVDARAEILTDAGMDGLFDTVTAATSKQMDLLDEISKALNVNLDFQDLHNKVFAYTGGPVSKANHIASIQNKFLSANAEER